MLAPGAVISPMFLKVYDWSSVIVGEFSVDVIHRLLKSIRQLEASFVF